MRVGVEQAPSWAATTPTLLVKEGYFTTPGANTARMYDISPDGQRFLMIKEGGGPGASISTSGASYATCAVGSLSAGNCFAGGRRRRGIC
jgi:hypothetical protein